MMEGGAGGRETVSPFDTQKEDHMKWQHQVDPVWLAARKIYLTASDIKKLIPVTATGKPRYNIEEAYLKVWADKQCLISEEDVNSSGAMARGHLLEPYAIDEFNKLGIFPVPLHHWDDTLIYSWDNVSFSPDSLDLMPPGTYALAGEDVPSSFMGEVKAYTGAAHYSVGMADKMTLEERWQIAAAFYTIPTLKKAALIMFNPSANHPVFVHVYERADLAKELEMTELVSNDYALAMNKFNTAADAICPAGIKAACITEELIIEELVAETDVNAGLNP